jgi:hypothetical protein
MQRPRGKSAARPTGTPVWVWVIYALGIFAATIFVLSVLFTAGAYLLSNDVPVTTAVSVRGFVLWGGLVLIAAVTFLWRRRR